VSWLGWGLAARRSTNCGTNCSQKQKQPATKGHSCTHGETVSRLPHAANEFKDACRTHAYGWAVGVGLGRACMHDRSIWWRLLLHWRFLLSRYPESAFIPFVSFGDLDNNTFKGQTSLLSVEQEIQYNEHTWIVYNDQWTKVQHEVK
jgi:hypothetical protein